MKRSEILSKSLDQTLELGKKLGERLSQNALILLEGDLGGGKTAFTKGLARGLGIDRQVISPTFTVMQMYDGKSLTLYHFDFYRLEKNDIVSTELLETLEDPKGVIVVEWAQKLEDILPHKHLVIKFQYIDDNSRKISFEPNGSYYDKLIGELV